KLSNDNNGYLSLVDGLLAIFLIFIAIAAFNMIIDMDIVSLSEESVDFKTSNDIMELIAMKVDGKDYSILERISYTLAKSNNNKASQREVATLLEGYFDKYLDGHYAFVENNQLKGAVLVSNGDMLGADNLTVATRDYGNYSYTLYIW
ncbi:MAG: hypothetical protein Q4P14_04995, partial [Methanobacteriaceae archaeon]|nr:hypothetical protein [Methanobacteriaceae archaeon]